MGFTDKFIIVWLSSIWVIFSVWSFIVTQFPLNFSVIGMESIAGIILIWIIVQLGDVSNVD